MVQLENATKEGSLQVEVDGSTYTPDPDSFSAQGFLGCPAGKGSLSGFCGKGQFARNFKQPFKFKSTCQTCYTSIWSTQFLHK